MKKIKAAFSTNSFLWIVLTAISLFFARTTFIAYKYAFIALLIPCIIITIKKTLSSITNVIWKDLIAPVAVVCLYAIHFKSYSYIYKESFNIAFVILFVLYLTSFIIKDNNIIKVLKLLCILTSISGIVAIVRKILPLFGLQIPFQSLLFEGNGFSLVNDNNFYSLHFILLIVISTYLLYQNQIKKTTFIAVNFLSVINIVASSSRRGYVLYCIVLYSFCLSL